MIFAWKPETTADQVDGLRSALDALIPKLPDLVSMTHGPDLQFRQGNGDYALIATFRDQAGWSAYQSDPGHKAFVQDVVTPITAARFAIQF